MIKQAYNSGLRKVNNEIIAAVLAAFQKEL